MTTIKAADIGYGFLKYPAGGRVEKVKAVVAEAGEALARESKGLDVLTVDGVQYFVGQAVYDLGGKPIVANENTGRAANIAYKVLALYALAKTYDSNEGPLLLITGLPFQNLDEAGAVKELLQATHTVELNGKELQLEIERVVIVSQGLGTFYSLVKQRGTAALSKKLLLVDLGFRTINYVPIESGNINPAEVKTASELGIQDAYRRIADGVNREFKTAYHYYDVDKLLDEGVVRQNRGKYFEKINDREYVRSTLATYAADVWNDIRRKYTDGFLEQLDEIVFAGGTADRVREQIDGEQDHYKTTFAETSQDAQVLGYEIIGEKLLAKK